MDTRDSSSGQYYIDTAPLSWRHIGITAAASLGQFVGCALATLASVIIPLIQIVGHPELSSPMQGHIGAADLIGICIGSAVFGRLIDRFGYILFFRLCPVIILVSSLVAYFFPTIPVLIVCLLVMGFGIGGEYSLDSGYISELMPDKWRFLMVGSAKSASSLGNIVTAAVCFWIVGGWHNAGLWPALLLIMAAVAVLMLLTRIGFHESPQWLLSKGRYQAAEKATHEFLGPDVNVKLPSPTDEKPAAHAAVKAATSYWGFIKDNYRKVVLTGIPWACEGLGVYGIGVFLPILVMSLGLEKDDAGLSRLAHVVSSVEVTFLISCIMLPGFILGLFLIRKMKSWRIQTIGFYLSAASLVVLLFSYTGHWSKWISIAAFMAFELFLNMGPHLITYVLPPQVYPVADRGVGSGLAAALGKVGAVLGVFFIPVLLHAGGASLVLIVSAAVMLVGGLITQLFRPRKARTNKTASA